MAQYPLYSSQLPYLPTSGMSPMYMQIPGNYPANYCMPVLGTVNNMGMYGGNISMGVNNYTQQTTAVTTQSNSEETKEPNRDNVSTSPQQPENNTASVSHTSDERAEYIEELNKERDNLDQGKEKESSHVRRLIERGLVTHKNFFLILSVYRDIISSVRTHTAHHQLRQQVGGCVQGKAHQIGGEGCSPCQGTSKGKNLYCIDDFYLFICCAAFVFACD